MNHSISTKSTHPPSSIPIRLTRAQRLANQKRQQQYNPVSTTWTLSTSKQSTQSTESKPTQRTSITRISKQSSRLTTPPKKQTKQLISSSLPTEHVHTMIQELTMLFSSAHYAKVSNEYIKLDSHKTWKATSIFTIPIAQEENRETWIQTHLSDYPLTMADMITRGAFLNIPSEFPTVEVFRQSYIDPHATYSHNHKPLWEVCGSPFPIQKYPLANWNLIQLYYDSSRIKQAYESCIHGNDTWYFHFWKYNGNELKQYGYSPYSLNLNPNPTHNNTS